MHQNQPLDQIRAGNPWYISDQFRSQFSRRGHRRIITNRWMSFASMIISWRAIERTSEIQVLDAGCGDGLNLLGLTNLSHSHNIPLSLDGVDYNPVRLQRARVNAPAATIHCASLLNLPFEDSKYDVVLCSHVLEHIPECRKALAELNRVLRPGGLLLTAVPNEGCLMARLRNNLFQTLISSTTDHVHFFTERSFSTLLIQSGFDISSIRRETFFFPHSYLNFLIAELPLGLAIMNSLRRTFPSQAGGLLFSSVKSTSQL